MVDPNYYKFRWPLARTSQPGYNLRGMFEIEHTFEIEVVAKFVESSNVQKWD